MVKKFKFATYAVAVFVAGAAWTQSASANTILNENFDELTPKLTVTSAGAFSAINGTNVDIVDNTMGYGALCAGPESGHCLDLGGTGGNANGILRSNTEFGPGQYLLSFDLVGSSRGQTDTTVVTLGDYNQTFTLGSGDITDGIVANAFVTVTSPGYLTFTEENPVGGSANIGNVLDNVLVSTAPSAVPEPLTLSMFGMGIAGAAALRRRKKS